MSEEFSMKVGVHQGPLPRVSYRTSMRKHADVCRLYADDLVIITESLEELQEKLVLWKTNVEGKGLRVNMGKTKVLISGPGSVLQKFDKDPCVVCLKGACRTNYIFCGGCSSWIHKRFSGTHDPLKADPSVRRKRCTG